MNPDAIYQFVVVLVFDAFAVILFYVQYFTSQSVATQYHWNKIIGKPSKAMFKPMQSYQ